MSRIFSSSFANNARSPTSNLNLDSDPLLSSNAPASERSNSISMANLSPRISRSPAISPSPPPSFYRDAITTSSRFTESPYVDSRAESPSPSPIRMKGRLGGKVQFAGPPPSIASSVLLPRQPGGQLGGTTRRPSSSLDGAGRHASPSATTTLIRSRRGSNSGVIDPLLGLERRERAIQKELQELLDAQSAGLVQGFGGAGDDNVSEAGSSTPTYDSTRSRSAGRREGSGVVIPVRQPKKKVVSLRGARRGLLRDIGELARIKGEEAVILAESIVQRETVLQKLAVWEQQIESFRKQLLANSENTGQDEDDRELAELRNEEKAVHNEIREMEDRLTQMKARRKWIQERVREGENRREARLSSWRGALKEVEGEVKAFLKRPPVFEARIADNEIEKESFMTLPINRRTLRMARELWTHEVSSLQIRQETVEMEKEALEQGARLWDESIAQVLEFEGGLRKQMAGGLQDVEMLKVQVRKMGEVIDALGGSLSVAEEKGWNLLICALGAELEAFNEGEGILRQALGMVEGVNGKAKDAEADNEDRKVGSNGLVELDGAGERRKSIEREESSDDDGPNLAELLVDNSHADGNGENSID